MCWLFRLNKFRDIWILQSKRKPSSKPKCNRAPIWSIGSKKALTKPQGCYSCESSASSMWTCLENLQQSRGRSANGNWTIAETSASAMLHCKRFQHAKKPCVVWNKQKLSNRTYICSEKHLSWYCTDTLLLHAQYFLFVVLHFIWPLAKCSKTYRKRSFVSSQEGALRKLKRSAVLQKWVGAGMNGNM